MTLRGSTVVAASKPSPALAESVMREIMLSERSAKTFWSRVEIAPGQCWPWRGNLDRAGYGRFGCSHSGGMYAAHRVSWFLRHGRQPDGYVCHACDNPRCVNPDHLWLGDAVSNMRDMAAKGRARRQNTTHCIHGHEFTPANTYTTPKGTRSCRRCNALAVRACKARRQP